MSLKTYRPDIDGLRALAIIPVILYHAGLALPGGFTGVDVFFVISGFLITSIIVSDVEDDSFSFKNFYEKRARRLLPALFFSLILTLFASYFFLYPGEFVGLAKSTISALLFLSNVFFYTSVDYFSPESEFLPLLHTWSLAVEEQFYLVWPFILLLFVWLKRRLSSLAALSFVFLIVISSFLLSVYLVEVNTEHAFYMFYSRVWELGIGSLIALIRLKGGKPKVEQYFVNICYVLGLSLIIGSYLLIESSASFPGLMALPVVLGTAMLLLFGDANQNKLAKIFEYNPIVYIGKISYSLYLIHWPVLSLYRTYTSQVVIQTYEVAALVSVILVLSVFSYHFIESPFRKKFRSQSIWLFSLCGGIIICAFSYLIIDRNGIKERVNNTMPEYLSSKNEMWEWKCDKYQLNNLPGRHCIFGEQWLTAERKIVLWGDSHADHFAPLIERMVSKENTAVLLYRLCPPFLDNNLVKRWLKGSGEYSDMCGERYSAFMSWIEQEKSIQTVILASAWSGYPNTLYSTNKTTLSYSKGIPLIEKGLVNTLSQLPENLEIHLLAEVPRPNVDLKPCTLLQNSVIKRRQISVDGVDCSGLSREKIESWHGRVDIGLVSATEQFENVTFYPIIDKLCTEAKCPIFIDDELIYMDGNHIRRNLPVNIQDELIMKLNLNNILLVK